MAKIRYNAKFLELLERIFIKGEYLVRYEKGNFKSGYCLIRNQKVAVVNKYLTTEGRINTLMEILKELSLDMTYMNETEKNTYLLISEQANPEIEANL